MGQIATPSSSRILALRGAPSGIAPSGSFADNGAVTLGTAFDTVIPGIYLRYPAGAIVAGQPAGSFFTIMSSTTQGVAFNNQLPTLGEPLVPTVLVPFVGVGPGPYVQVLATQFTLFSINIPGGSIGRSGFFRLSCIDTQSPTATVKTYRWFFGAFNFCLIAPGVNNVHPNSRTVRNCGVPNFQISENIAATFPNIVAGPTTPTYGTVDTTIDQTLSYTQQLNTAATDWAILYPPLVELFPAN